MPLGKKDKDPDVPAAEETEAVEKPKKKRIPGLVVYVAVVLVMIAAGYFVGTRFIGSSAEIASSASTEEPGQQDDSHQNVDHTKTQTVTIDDIIVNPSGTGGTRFLAASVGFEISSPKTVEVFEKRLPMIRDALITILGSKTIEQLSDPKEKEITRYQIKKRVEQLLSTDNLVAVYFTDFILQ
jgi:flagellar FliL protein